ncbi:hypothetical protein [Anaerocolumna xylanovorans]|uniref:Uncharacterized protein n=1 Tax=Anaerocolumna xylanovorans DSM 12503 TaxID=1121345 RepID=A0A1M7Y803_9FIRM|nr:hypothetical protein [Anaerocolumna xylanovorans]SHO48765.1 hypothetical protein SAMN02745217_02025 [Anaerocolumna xylanovorans DSM 12503]
MNSLEICLKDKCVVVKDHLLSIKLLDFNNKYTNLCLLPRKIQYELYIELWNLVTKSDLPEREKEMLLVIHALLIRYFSSTERTLKAVLTGDEVLLGQVVQYVDFFNREDLVFSLPVSRKTDYDMEEFIPAFIDYIHEVGNEIRNKCNLFLIDYRGLGKKESVILSEINQILDYKGEIILYHAPEEGLELSEFQLEEKFVIDKNNTIYLLESKKQYQMGEDEKKLVYQFQDIIGKLNADWVDIENTVQGICYEKKEKRLTIKLDAMISLVQRLETIVTENLIFHLHKDLKFEVNELKNTLLDFRYEQEDMEYFMRITGVKMEGIMSLKDGIFS